MIQKRDPSTGRILPVPFAVRFWTHVEKSDGCWNWIGHRFSNGYGSFLIDYRIKLAHRVSYQLATGIEPPRHMVVMHRCDNRACVRPDHLSIGTQQENLADMRAKGRDAHGEKSSSAKLSDAQVLSLRTLRKETGMSFRALGERFGICTMQAHRICAGTRRRNVTAHPERER